MRMSAVRLALLVLLPALLPAADIVGSDLVANAFTAGVERSSGGRMKADFAGTLPARKFLAAGRAGAAILVRRPGDAEPEVPAGRKLVSYSLANAAAVVVVHKSNKVEQVSLAELSGIFAKEARVNIINWNDLPGGVSELITPAVTSPEGSFVRELFLGVVMEGQTFRSDVRLNIPLDLGTELVASRTSAIQLMPYAPASAGRALQVSDGRPGKSSTAYSPDENNIFNGDYPLRLPLVLYVFEDRQAELRPALRWMLSDEAAELLRKQGLHPAPKLIRDRLAQRLDTR